MELPTSTDKCRFQTFPAVGQSVPSTHTADLPKDREISKPVDNDGPPSSGQILAYPKPSKQVVNLTCDEGDIIETASRSPTDPALLSSSPEKSSANIVDQHTMPSATATTDGKMYPWKNVPKWSPLYYKLQQRSTMGPHRPTVGTLRVSMDILSPTSTKFEPLPKDPSDPTAEQPKISLEIPETPAPATKKVRRKDNAIRKNRLPRYHQKRRTPSGKQST